MPDPEKLMAHMKRMQEMASRYLDPAPYIGRDGREWRTPPSVDEAFASDMIYMLDGPEQREAMAEPKPMPLDCTAMFDHLDPI